MTKPITDWTSGRDQKTDARKAVESVLRRATVAAPMTAKQVAQLAGIGLPLARHYIGRLMNKHVIVNTGRRNAGVYAWFGPTEEAPRVESRIPATNYAGTKWNIRAGADDHLKHGSRRGDEVIPWSPPLMISGRVVVVGVHGGKTL